MLDNRRGDIRMNEPGKILVVEDSAHWEELLKDTLSKEGYAVMVAHDYREAATALRLEPFDLMVNDFGSHPGDEEKSFQSQVLLDDAAQRDVPVVVVSGHITPEMIRKAFREYGVWGFFSKNKFDPQEFLQTIAEAIAKTREAGEQKPRRRQLTWEERDKLLRKLSYEFFSGKIVTFDEP
jgi:DNA-binding NtrC family response regulator